MEHSQFSCKTRKKSDFKFEIWEIFGFFFQIPTTREAFFSKKKCLRSCSKLAQMKFRGDKFRNFGTFATFFAKSEKNPISSLKFGQISNLKSHYFSLFQKKSQIFQN